MPNYDKIFDQIKSERDAERAGEAKAQSEKISCLGLRVAEIEGRIEEIAARRIRAAGEALSRRGIDVELEVKKLPLEAYAILDSVSVSLHFVAKIGNAPAWRKLTVQAKDKVVNIRVQSPMKSDFALKVADIFSSEFEGAVDESILELFRRIA